MSFTHERFLIEAIEQCHLYKIINYIKYGHNIHIENNLRQNLLIHLLKHQNCRDPFFEKKRLQVFKFLITHGNFNVHSFDDYGKNLFNWATNLNCTQEALYLLRSYSGDIDILIRDQSGLCSLHYAIEHGNEVLVHDIVNYFLQYRIRFDIKDNYNNTPEELARKLGYDYLADFLSVTCQSTLFMSREIPFLQQRVMTNKTKATTSTRISMTTLSSSVLDSSEFYNLTESKIETARNLNDWKMVAALRSNKKHTIGKKINQSPMPTIQVSRPTTTSSGPSKLSPINITPSSSGGESIHMLHLIEPQLSSSYRQAFVPYYQSIEASIPDLIPSSTAQRKTSIASRRMSTVINLRKRDSNTSRSSVITPQDGQPRLSLPPVHKQRKQSIVPGRLSDGVKLTKLRSKNLITVQN